MARSVIALTVLIVLALLEVVIPRRFRVASRASRCTGNILIQLLNTLVLRWLFPWALPVAAALSAQKLNFGVLYWLTVSYWVAFPVSILLLDLMVYWQHRLMHYVPLLWRLHRMHHADVDVDVTTALRFHPFEIVLSAALKSAVVWVLGVPAEAVIVFAVILNGMAMFNHANLNLPVTVDHIVRQLLVTPDMHRVHHSVLKGEHDSNFGFNLSIWDRLFGSYTDQPQQGHLQMKLGLDETNGQQTGSVWWMLIQPFR